MLIPERISKKDRDDVIEMISLLAQNPDSIDVDLQTTSKGIEFARKANNFLGRSDIFQYELPDLPLGKIILSYDVYVRLCGYAALSNYFEKGFDEYGGYLFGKEIDNNTIYFDSCNKVQSNINSRKFITTIEMQNEIEERIKDNKVDCVCHVHTHPYSDYAYSGTPSNQDLYTYAWLQEQFNYRKKKVNFLGALITPTDDSKDAYNDICFMFYDNNLKKFYKITNIYYVDIDGKVKPLRKESYSQYRNGNLESVENRTVLLKLYADFID